MFLEKEKRMSAYLRPVIERWGEGHNYGPLDHDEMIDLIDTIAWFSGTGDVSQEEIAHADYSDVERVYIKHGFQFLNYLRDHSEAEFCEAVNASDEMDELTGEQYSVYEELRAMETTWRKMVDPEDGSLRFYVD